MRKKRSRKPAVESKVEKQVLGFLKTKDFKSRRAILQQLQCDDDVLGRVLAELKDTGIIEGQRGRSGGYRLIEKHTIKEQDYYDIIERSLAKWFRVEGGHVVVVRTAYGGAKKTGGKWTRPDFYIVHRVKYECFHHVVVEYVAIEVKVWDERSSVADVYEVLNHRTCATSALVMYVGSIQEASNTDRFEAIERACMQHGIGLVFVSIASKDIDNDAKVIRKNRFHEQVKWATIAPSPKSISEFIKAQFKRDAKAKYQELVDSVAQE